MCHKADSATSLARVAELEELLSAAQQERDLVNEMLQLHKVRVNCTYALLNVLIYVCIDLVVVVVVVVCVCVCTCACLCAIMCVCSCLHVYVHTFVCLCICVH